MLEQSKQMKKLIKYTLTIKQNLLLILLLIIFSCVQTISPLQQKADFFVYKYGIFGPWIECFNRNDLGAVNIFQTVLSDSNLGILWYPQNIIFSIVFINIFVVFFRYIRRK